LIGVEEGKGNRGNYNFVLIRTTWVEYMGLTNKKSPYKLLIYKDFTLMAERAGFEPAVGLTLRTLSRRVT